MAEYIEREALMVALCKEIIGDGDYYNGKDDMQDEIRDMVSRFPATDVAPVVHGRWIEAEQYVDEDEIRHTQVRCSLCGRYEDEREPYCNCGAKMNGGDGDAKSV